MSLDRSAPLADQVTALMDTESRRWIKTLPPDLQAWLESCGPRHSLPVWLIDVDADLIPRSVEIQDFAEAQLPVGLRERVIGAVGDSIIVMTAARLLPTAVPLRDQVLPLLDQVWAALNDNDHQTALMTLPLISGAAGRAYQMLEHVDRPNAQGRKRGSGYDDSEFVDEYLRRLSEGERPEPLKDDIAPRMLGGGTVESKRKRLERAVSARANSLPSSPMK